MTVDSFSAVPFHHAVGTRCHGHGRQLFDRGRLGCNLASSCCDSVLFTVNIGQTPDFEGFRHSKQRPDLFLRNIYFAFVHELDSRFEFGKFDIPHNYNGVLAGILEEQGLEIGAAGR